MYCRPVACFPFWTFLTYGYVLFACRKNGRLPDYMPDSSARQRKVEVPGDEDKLTYIAVVMKMSLSALLCCSTCNREWSKAAKACLIPQFWEQLASNLECNLSEFLSGKNFDILFASGTGAAIYDLCASVPPI